MHSGYGRNNYVGLSMSCLSNQKQTAQHSSLGLQEQLDGGSQ